jgi:hypothetical protein
LNPSLWLFTLLAVLPVREVRAVDAPPLDARLFEAVRVHLLERSSVSVAREALAFLDSHPTLRLRVDWTPDPDDEETFASWDREGDAVVLSSAVVAGCGAVSSSSTLSPSALRDCAVRVAPYVVHEAAHAETAAGLPFRVAGNLESELIGWAYECAFIRADPRAGGAAALAAGRIWIDELMPASERLNALGERITGLRKRQDELREAGREEEAETAYQEHVRLYRLWEGLRDEVLSREGQAVKRLGSRDEGLLQQAGALYAYTKGCGKLERYVAALHPVKPRLFAKPAELEEHAAELRRRAAVLEEACPRIDKSDEQYKACPVLLASMKEQLAFWDDPARVEQARRHYLRRLAAVCPASFTP